MYNHAVLYNSIDLTLHLCYLKIHIFNEPRIYSCILADFHIVIIVIYTSPLSCTHEITYVDQSLHNLWANYATQCDDIFTV